MSPMEVDLLGTIGMINYTYTPEYTKYPKHQKKRCPNCPWMNGRKI